MSIIRTLGSIRLLRKYIPGLGKKEAYERSEDEWFTYLLYKEVEDYNPDQVWDKENEFIRNSSYKCFRRYSRIAQGRHPFKP